MVDNEAGSLGENPVKDVSRRNGAVVVRLFGELDLYNAPLVRKALLASVADNPERLVVDLSEVSFMDSTALGVLVEARASLQNRRALLLAGPGAEARRVLEVSGLDRHFRVHESVEQALTAAL
jgi:anti-sigma B factor antagonist